MQKNQSNYTFSNLGLGLRWNAQDREELRKHNRYLWKRLMEDEGYDKNTPIENIVFRRKTENGSTVDYKFLDVLEELSLTGYGSEDISVMFGKTVKRVREWFHKYGLKTNMYKGHINFITFDHNRSRFSPVSKEEIVRRHQDAKRRNREDAKESRYEAEQQRHRKVFREIVEEKGRIPLLSELTERLGYSKGSIRSIAIPWGYINGGDRGISYDEAINSLYRSEGFRHRLKRAGKMKSRGDDTLGARITQKRLEKGLSQKELGSLTGIATREVSIHERDGQKLRNKTLNRYAQFFGVTVDWLLNGD